MQAQAEPHGRIRFSCPSGMVATVSELITRSAHATQGSGFNSSPPTALSISSRSASTSRSVRAALSSNAELTIRSLGRSVRILVAGPQVASGVATGKRLAPPNGPIDERRRRCGGLKPGGGRRSEADDPGAAAPRLHPYGSAAWRRRGGAGVALLPIASAAPRSLWGSWCACCRRGTPGRHRPTGGQDAAWSAASRSRSDRPLCARLRPFGSQARLGGNRDAQHRIGSADAAPTVAHERHAASPSAPVKSSSHRRPPFTR